MEFLKEAIWALALVGLPIGLFTLAIVWWSMRNGHFGDLDEGQSLSKEIKAASKLKTKPENDKRDLLQKKWAKFGGGFYGIVAFFTYVVIEITEIGELIFSQGGLWDFIRQIDVSVIVHIFVEGIKNFVAAMVWPVYWMRRIDTSQTWIWFVAAYLGYWLGLRLAQEFAKRRANS